MKEHKDGTIIRQGLIQQGDYVGWRVEVVDNQHETGGYYIFINSPDGLTGYDEWIEAHQLEGFFTAADWNVAWDVDAPANEAPS